MDFRLPKVSIITSDSSGNNTQGEFSTLSLGLGLHRAWTYLTLFCATTVFSAPTITVAESSEISLNIFYLVCTAISVACLFLAATMKDRVRSMLLADKAPMVCCILCAASTALLAAAPVGGQIGSIFCIIASAVSGISNACLILMWAMSYARNELMTIVVNTAVSIFIALLIFALIAAYVPHPINQAATVLLPLLQIPFINQNLHPRHRNKRDLPKPSLLPMSKRSLGARLAFPLLLFGFALGVMRFYAETSVNVTKDPLLFFLSLLLSGIVIILLLVVIFYFAESQMDESIMRYTIPIIILAVIFLPIPSSMGHVIAGPLLMTSYLCFKAVIWVFLCGLCQRFRLSPLFVVGIGFSAMALGSFVSSICLALGDAFVSITPFGDYASLVLAVVAMVVAYSLLPRTADIRKMMGTRPHSEGTARQTMRGSKAADTSREPAGQAGGTEGMGGVYDAAPSASQGSPNAQPTLHAGGESAAAEPISAHVETSPAQNGSKDDGRRAALGSYGSGTAMPKGTGTVSGHTGAANRPTSAASAVSGSMDASSAVASTTADADAPALERASVTDAKPAPHPASRPGAARPRARTGAAASRASSVAAPAHSASGSSKRNAAPSLTEDGASTDTQDAFYRQCTLLGDKYLLSRRENEVLYLLARGHNAAYIQDKLCVAQSTTKTHIYHIYQKLGIHTQQELITMVNEGLDQ